MKDKGIARDVGGRKRSAGDAPNLGQISRMASSNPESSEKGERRRRRRTSEDGGGGGRQAMKQKADRRAATLVWTLAFGFLALALIAGVFVFWLKPLMDRRDAMAAAATRPAKLMPVEVSPLPATITFGEKEAINLAKRAMNARDEEEVEAAIHIGSISPAKVIESMKTMRAADGEIVRYDWVSRLDTTRPDIEGVLVTFKKDKERNRLILLTPDAKKNWKMDYAAFARLAVPDWSELLEGRAKSAVVRVYVAADQYYNGPFPESDGWKCYGLASPDIPDLMFGYCKAGTQQNMAIARTLEGGNRLMRMTIEIEKIEGAEARQYLVKRVLAQDWAIGKTALDEE